MISRRPMIQASVAGIFLAGFPAAKVLAQDNAPWDEIYDVIVVGGGGAGLAAAVAAAQNQASVCVLEKLAVLGGDTLRSTGYFACVEPERQKRQHIKDSTELHYEQTMQAGGNLANGKVVRYMVEHALETARWLEECGVVFGPRIFEIYGSVAARCLRPLQPRGIAYIRSLSQKALSLGVRIREECPLQTLVVNASGRVVGVSATNAAGDTLRLQARRGVVLATGGFGANEALIRQYAPQYAGLPSDNSPGSTGDALVAAGIIGAALEGLQYVECVAGNPPGRKTHARIFLPSDFIWVNTEGRRFVEEDALRAQLSQAISEQPEKRCFCVFDAQGLANMDLISQKGIYQALVADEAYSADTLGELAAMMKIPKESFIDSVRGYNRALSESGVSRRGKCSRVKCLKIARPPYWALDVGLTVHYTVGGLTVNEKAQCLNASGIAIEGLWAAGEVTGSVHGANRLGGNGLTDALTNGRLAGIEASKKRN